MWRDLHREPGNLMPAVTVHSAEQLTQFLRIEDRGMMLGLRNHQRPSQDSARVTFAPPGCHGVAEDAASKGPAAPGRLILAFGLNALERGQQVEIGRAHV